MNEGLAHMLNEKMKPDSEGYYSVGWQKYYDISDVVVEFFEDENFGRIGMILHKRSFNKSDNGYVIGEKIPYFSLVGLEGIYTPYYHIRYATPFERDILYKSEKTHLTFNMINGQMHFIKP